jgi:hypothetical protein
VNQNVGRQAARRLSIGLVLLLGLVLAGTLAACDSARPAPTDSSSPSRGPVAIGGSPSPATATAGPGDLGLQHVRVETDGSRQALIPTSGGTVSATGANGAIYTLAIPKGALGETTSVSISPVTTVTTLPSGAVLAAGVQFGPDGLHFATPATLTIQLPAGVDASTLHAISWRGDGQRPQRYPATRSGQTFSVPILHFSGLGLSPADVAAVFDCVGAADVYECETDSFLQLLVDDAARADAASRLPEDLRFFYANVAEPALATGDLLPGDPDAAPDRHAEDQRAYPLAMWMGSFGYVGSIIGNPRFTMPAELARSKLRAAAFVRFFYAEENHECVVVKDDLNVHNPLFWAETALSKAKWYAAAFHVDTAADGLDLRTLLDQLCVQVVIDPHRAFSGIAPGDTGDLTVQAGFTIAGGPLRFMPNPVRVTAVLRESGETIGDRDTESDGTFTVPGLVWPVGVDPLVIDLTATLTDDVGGQEVLTDIARFDRLTQRGERLSFTFDRGFDSWSSGVAGPEGSSNWGLVDHLSVGGGVMHMDGRGNPSRANAWIFRSFRLPSTTTTMSFDASAELIAGSSSSVRVRVVAGGVSTVLLSATLRNSHNSLSFTQKQVDLSRWAGKQVTIYIEQNDNTPSGAVGFDKEIYIDNVLIAT